MVLTFELVCVSPTKKFSLCKLRCNVYLFVNYTDSIQRNNIRFYSTPVRKTTDKLITIGYS